MIFCLVLEKSANPFVMIIRTEMHGENISKYAELHLFIFKGILLHNATTQGIMGSVIFTVLWLEEVFSLLCRHNAYKKCILLIYHNNIQFHLALLTMINTKRLFQVKVKTDLNKFRQKIVDWINIHSLEVSI